MDSQKFLDIFVIRMGSIRQFWKLCIIYVNTGNTFNIVKDDFIVESDELSGRVKIYLPLSLCLSVSLSYPII